MRTATRLALISLLLSVPGCAARAVFESDVPNVQVWVNGTHVGDGETVEYRSSKVVEEAPHRYRVEASGWLPEEGELQYQRHGGRWQFHPSRYHFRGRSLKRVQNDLVPNRSTTRVTCLQDPKGGAMCRAGRAYVDMRPLSADHPAASESVRDATEKAGKLFRAGAISEEDYRRLADDAWETYTRRLATE